MMKILCCRQSLLSALQQTELASAKKAHKPELTMTLAHASDGVLRLSATDLEIGLVLPASGVEVQRDGVALLPRKLAEVLKESRDSRVSIETDGFMLKVNGDGGQSDFELASADAGAFPEVPSTLRACCFTVGIAADQLLALLKRTVFAVSQDASRYSMSGVNLEYDHANNWLTAVGTDGRRLAVTKASVTGEQEKDSKARVLPTKAVTALCRLLQTAGEESVTVSFSDNEALFTLTGIRFYSRLLEGRYPDWRTVVREGDRLAIVEATALLAAVRQAAVTADEAAPTLLLAFSGHSLRLSASGESTGRSKVEIIVDADAALKAESKVNPEFLCDYLKVAQEGEVTMVRLKGGPLLFRRENYEYLVMPLA